MDRMQKMQAMIIRDIGLHDQDCVPEQDDLRWAMRRQWQEIQAKDSNGSGSATEQRYKQRFSAAVQAERTWDDVLRGEVEVKPQPSDTKQSKRRDAATTPARKGFFRRLFRRKTVYAEAARH